MQPVTYYRPEGYTRPDVVAARKVGNCDDEVNPEEIMRLAITSYTDVALDE